MKQFRELSIDGCPEIGRGAHGIVYRIAPDMLVKVYNSNASQDDIRQERELARWAFVKGIPTAIPFDTVRVGEQYGTVFELLNSRSSADYINESPEHFEQFLQSSVELMKQVHAIEVEPGILPDMKQQTMGWLAKIREVLSPETYTAAVRLVEEIPDRYTVLHADFHMKNILICNKELMLIDMDTLCTGDPIFELATIFASYRQFPSLNPKAVEMLGIDVETGMKVCDRTFELYLEGADEEELRRTKRKAQILCCIRIIDFFSRHAEIPDRDECVHRCLQDMTELLKE